MFGAGAFAVSVLLWLAGYCPGAVVVGVGVGWLVGLLLGFVLDEVSAYRAQRAQRQVLAEISSGKYAQQVIRTMTGR